MLVISVGVREAARQMGIAEPTVQAWSARYGWLEHLTSPAKIEKPLSMKGATVATKPADALRNILQENSLATRTAALRYAKATTEHAANVAEDDPKTALTIAQDVKAVVQTAALAGGWAANQENNLKISIFTTGSEPPVIDV